MLKVHVARNPMEAHLVLGLLEAEGIRGEVRGEALFTTLQGGAAAEALLPAVWIEREQQGAAALACLARYRDGQGAAAEAEWRCGCGEQHGAQFTHCWRCGGARYA